MWIDFNLNVRKGILFFRQWGENASKLAIRLADDVLAFKLSLANATVTQSITVTDTEI